MVVGKKKKENTVVFTLFLKLLQIIIAAGYHWVLKHYSENLYYSHNILFVLAGLQNLFVSSYPENDDHGFSDFTVQLWFVQWYLNHDII